MVAPGIAPDAPLSPTESAEPGHSDGNTGNINFLPGVYYNLEARSDGAKECTGCLPISHRWTSSRTWTFKEPFDLNTRNITTLSKPRCMAKDCARCSSISHRCIGRTWPLTETQETSQFFAEFKGKVYGQGLRRMLLHLPQLDRQNLAIDGNTGNITTFSEVKGQV